LKPIICRSVFYIAGFGVKKKLIFRVNLGVELSVSSTLYVVGTDPVYVPKSRPNLAGLVLHIDRPLVARVVADTSVNEYGGVPPEIFEAT
jgi:hypothetical protein